MIRALFVLVFKITGWKIVGEKPAGLKQYILAFAPHTSNWDFVYGVMMRSIMRLRNAKFLAKKSIFIPPFGWFFRLMGGYPVDRSKSHDLTDQVAGFFRENEYFIIAIAPEGTRHKVDKLKSGFYYIAKKAGIPIVPFGLDYGKKEVIIGAPIFPGDSFEDDISRLMSFYRSIRGKNPEWGL